MAKSIFIGALVGLLFVLVSNMGVIGALLAFVIIVAVASMMDWSGQGDGREGCNRHTSCNH